ncbi:MAG: gliding motility protein GldC [Bacteroidia bacterium]|nr:gliding motility protein GldC [Bacteroidia bacterium]MCZ2276563.1 gliding motility protein GldC [Bacteroidia bacterium]
MKKSEIKIIVDLDENNHPEKIHWQAEGAGKDGLNPCKSMMLSLWDTPEEGTLRIDLWTKEMLVSDMQRFVYETMLSMANTYEKATDDKQKSEWLRNMANHFGTDAGLLKPQM